MESQLKARTEAGRLKRATDSNGALLWLLLLPAIFASSMSVRSQVFTTLHTFLGPDGESPEPTLLVTNGVIYGTAPFGGSGSSGVIYSMLTNGSGFKVLHSFSGADGSEPRAGLFLDGTTLYGTAAAGGSHGNGTVFSLGTDGTRFTVLHVFGPETGTTPIGIPTNSDGVGPWGPVIVWSNRLYGTTVWGGGRGNRDDFFSKSQR